MTVQPPNTETHNVRLSSTFAAELAGLEEVYRLLEGTKRLLGTTTALGQLTSYAELGTPLRLCPLHTAVIENLTQQAITSVEQRVEELERCVEEMKGRLVVMEQRLDALEWRVGGTEMTMAGFSSQDSV